MDFDDEEFSTMVLDYMTDIVNLTPQSIRRIEFEIDFMSQVVVTEDITLDWGRLDKILRNRPNLREVHFKSPDLEGDYPKAEFYNYITSALPTIHAKSLLRFAL